MGGSDAFEPQELCKQIDALSGLQSKKGEEDEDKEKVDTENHIIWDDNLVLDDDKLQWNDRKKLSATSSSNWMSMESGNI